MRRLNRKGNGDHLAKVIDGDRRFFHRHPDRSHRVRRAAVGEIEDLHRIAGIEAPLSPPAGFSGFIAVRQNWPGCRARAPFYTNAEMETDLTEAEAARWFEGMSPGDGGKNFVSLWSVS